MRVSLLVAFGLLLGGGAWADEVACAPGLARAEREARLPGQILPTLALVESGRLVGGRVTPWPWTVNVNGEGHFYESKAEAVAAVQAFQAGGARSIDVGCMQINLLMHPHAFGSLEDAFDPEANTRYGAQFLRALYAASGQWGLAITAYHSSTPVFAADYARKVLAVWPGAAALGVAGGAPAVAGTDAPMAERHDYTVEFARQVAADMALRRARLAQAGPLIPVRSLLRAEPVALRHGPAWPRGVP